MENKVLHISGPPSTVRLATDREGWVEKEKGNGGGGVEEESADVSCPVMQGEQGLWWRCTESVPPFPSFCP